MDVMTVDRPYVLQPQLFPERAGNECSRDQILERFSSGQHYISDRWNRLQNVFDFVLQVIVGPGAADAVQITRQGAHIRRNGHLVIVQKNYHPLLQVPNLVYSLESHARRQSSVADKGNYVEVLAFQVSGGCDSQR